MTPRRLRESHALPRPPTSRVSLPPSSFLDQVTKALVTRDARRSHQSRSILAASSTSRTSGTRAPRSASSRRGLPVQDGRPDSVAVVGVLVGVGSTRCGPRTKSVALQSGSRSSSAARPATCSTGSRSARSSISSTSTRTRPLLGVQRRRLGHHDRRRPARSSTCSARRPPRAATRRRELAMLSETRPRSAASTSRPTACCSPPPISLGSGSLMAQAQARGLRPERSSTSASTSSPRALVGAKLLLLVTDFRRYVANPRELVDAPALGRRLLRRADRSRHRRRIVLHPPHGLPLWTTCDVFAPGIALGHVVGRFGCFSAAAATASRRPLPWAITFTDPFAHDERRHAARRAAAPDAALPARRGRLPGLPDPAWATGRKTFAGAGSGSTCCSTRSPRFIIEFFRGDERGFVIAGMLSTSQFISILLAPLAIVMLVFLSRRRRAEAKRS